MDSRIKILIVEDVATDAELIQMELEDAQIVFEAKQVESRDSFKEQLEIFNPDVVISDYNLPGFGALEALKIKNEINPFIPFILVTGAQTEEIAVDCIKQGADDYILKSSLTRLPTSITNALKKKRAEKKNIEVLIEIKAREEKYRNLFENSIVGMFRAHREGCKFIEVNEKAKEILGIQSVEGMHFDDFKWCNNSGRLSELVENGVECVENFEVHILHPDKGRIWVSISAKLYNKEGVIEGVIHDITQSKNSLIVLEKANYELDKFTYHASHDLRSPLRSLEGLLQVALEENTIEEIRPIMKMMQKSTSKMDNLINDLLVLAQNKRSEATIVSIDFFPEIKDCLFQLAHMDNFSRVEINYNVNQQFTFLSDAVRLRIILYNIISNAIKYHRYDQPNPNILIDVSVTEELAKISIKDNGAGISSKDLERVFDMFYRANTESEGSGLGLFLVKTTVEKLNGKIHVESEVGMGTSFYIEIPNHHKQKVESLQTVEFGNVS